MHLCEFILVEKDIRTEIGNDTVSILVDPVASRLVHLVNTARYKQVRGLVGGRYMYFWDSFYATHHEMAEQLGIEYNKSNCAHIWLADDQVRLDFLDRPTGNFPDIPEIHRLMLSPRIFFDSGYQYSTPGTSLGYLSGPEMIEWLG